MDWEEKDLDIMDKIRQNSEDIEVPKALSPENMMKKIEETEKKRRRNMKNFVKVLAAAVAAACIGAVAFSGWQFSYYNNPKYLTFSGKSNGKYNYSKIYEKLKEVEIVEAENEIYYSDGVFVEDAVVNDAESAEHETAAKYDVKSESDQSVSNTNVQVKGIDEADMVKSDGKYIYAMDNNKQKIDIISIEDEKKVSEIQTIKSYLSYTNADMYVSGNVLVVIGTYVHNETEINIFDISDKENPVKINSISQQGNYDTSRLKGDYLYVMSVSYINGELTEENCVPRLEDKQIEADCVVLTEEVSALEYQFVISIDLGNPEKVLDKRAITINSSNSYTYMSPSNIYVANYSYNDDKTEIIKIGYMEGRFSSVKEGYIDGKLYGQFAMDEYNDNLRLVSTRLSNEENEVSNGRTNQVYVLNKDLKVCGKIDGIADGESIYSARYMGDTGYFVTYYQTDPLFKVDFSDPSNPVILGQLEITGFSDYLHPWGEDKLLGIGYVDDKLKLSMFKIGEGGEMDEISRKVFEYCYFSPATDNHKSIMVDDEENLIGFIKCNVNYHYLDKCEYEVYSYNDGEFTCRLSEELLNDPDNLFSTRGIFTDKKLYIVYPGEYVKVYNKESMELLNEIRIR